MKPTNQNREIFVFYCMSLILGIIYGSSWLGIYELNHEQSVIRITQFTDQRPYVFRILLPFLTRILSDALFIPPDYAILFMMTIVYVGMLWSLQKLGNIFSEDQTWVIALSFATSIVITFILFTEKARKIYDPATVLFFALALSFLARNKFWEYYIIFPFATLNREITFLLLGFFAIYYFKKIPFRKYIVGLAYQTIIYVAIKFILEKIFSSNGGKSFFLFDYQVIQTYLTHPLLATFILLAICLIFIGALWKPSSKPEFLKTAFVFIFPAQILLHIILGAPYEFRVFLESIPVIFALFVSTRPKSNILVTNY